MQSKAKELGVLCVTDMFKASVQKVSVEWLLDSNKGVLEVWATNLKIPCFQGATVNQVGRQTCHT